MKKYLITSREFYTDTPAVFRDILYQQLIKYRPDFVLYRDKNNPNYSLQASYFTEVCSQFNNIKSFIHRDISLAKELNATGVHLTSTQFTEIEYALSLDLEVIISTHNYNEVLNAQKLGATYVTYSPIFISPHKGKPKGIKNLKELLLKTDIKIFALGGIMNEENLQDISKTDVFGFASIRYFYSK